MEKENPSYRKLRTGEFAYVEAKYSLDKNFDLTGADKIQSPNDVAFIMKSLQKASIEHGFVVYVLPNDKPIIQHIGMGTNSASMINFHAISDAVSRFQPKGLYFVHNHPSGNITPSNADKKIFDKLSDIYEDKYLGSLVINITSGEYSFIDPYQVGSSEKISKGEQENMIHHKTLKFDRQVFKEDVNFSKITSSEDVAKILSGFKFSLGKKMGLLILNRANNVVANIILSANALQSPETASDIKSYITRFNGTSAVLYCNNKNNELDNPIFTKNIKEIKRTLQASDMDLLDFMVVNATPNIIGKKYDSAADMGLMEEKGSYRKEKDAFSKGSAIGM